MEPDSRRAPTDPASVAPAAPPARRISRRASLIGGVVAVAVVAGIGWLAWSLTQKPVAAPAGVAAPGPGGGGPGGGGPGGGGPGGGGGGRGGPATTVGIAVAERTDIPVTLEALGTVVPQATVRVRPQVSGVLQQVLFKEGQMVRKGDLLATIDPRQFEMTLQQAIGQRMRDQAQLDAARVTLQRFAGLLAQDSIARQEVDTQAALVKQLEATVVVDKANEGTARLNLGYTRIVAPIGGRVGLRTVDVGNVVGTTDANGVALLTQLSPIDVEFAVPQDLAPALARDTGAAMDVKALDRTRATVLDTGSFASLDNQVDTQTGTVRAKARFANSQQALFPSQFVNVRVQLRTVQGAVVVPVAALRTGPTGDYVFVLRDDRTVSLRPVTRGQATVDKVQLATGLQAGERVVTEGADRLRDGSRVTLPGAGGAGARRDGASGPRGGASAAAGSGRIEQPATAAPPAAAALPAAASAPPAAAAQGARPPATATDGQPRATAAPAAAPSAAPAAAISGPTPEQRKRMLDAAQDDPEKLERRKKFLEALDRKDPAALERWQQMQSRREAGGAPQQ